MIKQVIIMRTDLNMRKGKMIAQGSHASMKVFFDRMKYFTEGQYPIKDLDKVRKGDKSYLVYFYEIKLTYEMKEWIEDKFTKIVVGCGSLEELLELQKKAEEANIVNAIIEDSGATEFKENCSQCNDKKYIWLTECEDGYTCDECKGTGKINKPTITCLAIGPDESEKIDKITGHLILL